MSAFVKVRASVAGLTLWEELMVEQVVSELVADLLLSCDWAAAVLPPSRIPPTASCWGRVRRKYASVPERASGPDGILVIHC